MIGLDTYLIYNLNESLLDDLDDLDAKSDGVIISDELSKLMGIMMPLYKGNFKTEFHKFYDPKTNIFNVANMSTVCLYITKHNNNIYKPGSVFIDGDIILRKNWDGSYSAVYNKV